MFCYTFYVGEVERVLFLDEKACNPLNSTLPLGHLSRFVPYFNQVLH